MSSNNIVHYPLKNFTLPNFPPKFKNERVVVFLAGAPNQASEYKKQQADLNTVRKLYAKYPVYLAQNWSYLQVLLKTLDAATVTIIYTGHGRGSSVYESPKDMYQPNGALCIFNNGLTKFAPLFYTPCDFCNAIGQGAKVGAAEIFLQKVFADHWSNSVSSSNTAAQLNKTPSIELYPTDKHHPFGLHDVGVY